MHRSHCIRETGHVCGLRLSSCMCVNGHRKPPLYCARGARWPRSPTEPLGARGLVVVRHFSGSRPRFGVPVPARAPIGGRRDFNEVLCTASSSSAVRVPTRRSAVPARRGRRALLWRSSALWGLPAGGRAGGPLYFALSGVWWRDFRAANPRPKVQRKN